MICAADDDDGDDADNEGDKQQHKADGGMTMWTASVGFGQLVRLAGFFCCAVNCV